MKNEELAMLFAEGAERGTASHMTIEGDRLYSYAACIAIRDENKFILANRTNYFGGGTCSKTTSAHISYAYDACKKVNPVILVDGWAERNKPEWFTPAPYKTIRGIMKGFASGMYGGWVGKWCRETRTKQIEFEIKNDKLFAGNTLIATREYASHNAKYPPDEICEICPKKFACLTERPLEFHWRKCPHYLFSTIKNTEYEELVCKVLKPNRLVD